MNLSTLDRIHAAARSQPGLQRLAIISRILLALAFIPTGMVKVLGERFTVMGMDTPIGLFFEALYRSGFYWNFIGWAQVIAGVLLLIPATVTLGALVAFPVILNIFVITTSLRFIGTPFITGGMLLASIFLLCWDYDRLKGILHAPDTVARRPAPAPPGPVERAGYVIGTLAGLGLFGTTRGLVPSSAMLPLLALGILAALLVLAAWIRAALPPPPAPRSIAR